MKDSTRQIKLIFEEIYSEVSKKYFLEKPKLKVVHYQSSTLGRCVFSKNLISINSHGQHYKKTIIHELLHLVNQKYFNFKNKKKLGHNKQFWLLCYEFGLTETDYGYGLTKSMEKAKIEYEKKINEVI